ncbi:MAG: rhodanese-like domain-containing protein [Gammaproteobacteria bacterium]|nr:rhodanese-like domain-containing protein [Gammaproteobacteria bacterium]
MEKSFSERVAEAKAKVSAISPQEAKERKANEPDILFIDPRSAADISATTGIIPGALNVPLSELHEKSDHELPQELGSHSRPIIAACEAGPMGALAAYALKQRGFRNVAFMDGGTRGWLEAGYATAR